MTIASLQQDTDSRIATIRVAGPAVLLVAKAYKMAERIIDDLHGRPHRVKPKDAGDVIRLMRLSHRSRRRRHSTRGDGLRQAAVEPARTGRIRLVCGVAVLAAGLSSSACTASCSGTTALAGAIGMLYLLVLAVTLLAPWINRNAARLLARCCGPSGAPAGIFFASRPSSTSG
jgi:hypothetical protein